MCKFPYRTNVNFVLKSSKLLQQQKKTLYILSNFAHKFHNQSDDYKYKRTTFDSVNSTL